MLNPCAGCSVTGKLALCYMLCTIKCRKLIIVCLVVNVSLNRNDTCTHQKLK